MAKHCICPEARDILYLCRISLASRQHKTNAKQVATPPMLKRSTISPSSPEKERNKFLLTETYTLLNQNVMYQPSLAQYYGPFAVQLKQI
jgi:hypothetical protein